MLVIFIMFTTLNFQKPKSRFMYPYILSQQTHKRSIPRIKAYIGITLQ